MKEWLKRASVQSTCLSMKFMLGHCYDLCMLVYNLGGETEGSVYCMSSYVRWIETAIRDISDPLLFLVGLTLNIFSCCGNYII